MPAHVDAELSHLDGFNVRPRAEPAAHLVETKQQKRTRLVRGVIHGEVADHVGDEATSVICLS